MKLTGQFLIIILLANVLLSLVMNYFGESSYSSEGGFVSASECDSPESHEAILYCGERHCLNVMQLDNLITQYSDVTLTNRSYAFSSNPDKVKMQFSDKSNSKSILCVLEKSSVVSVTYTQS